MKIHVTATVCFHAFMTRAGKRQTEREAVTILLASGYRRVGEPKLWVSKAKGWEEFSQEYQDASGNRATLKTRYARAER